MQYAPRNPDLQNNWRGKARVDKVEFYDTEADQVESISSLIEKAELEDNLKDDSSEAFEEMCFNERALEMAMKKGLSIWRSHGGKEPVNQEIKYFVKCLPDCLSVCLLVCLFVSLFITQFVLLSVCLFVFLTIITIYL